MFDSHIRCNCFLCYCSVLLLLFLLLIASMLLLLLPWLLAASTAVIKAKNTSLRIEIHSVLWKCLRFVQLWMQYVITIPRILISISQWNILIIISYQLNWLVNAYMKRRHMKRRQCTTWNRTKSGNIEWHANSSNHLAQFHFYRNAKSMAPHIDWTKIETEKTRLTLANTVLCQ